MAKTRKKGKGRKTSGKKGGGSSGGGGVLTSMRSGFRKAAHRAAGGGSKKPQTKAGKIINWVLTLILVAVVIWVLGRRFGYL